MAITGSEEQAEEISALQDFVEHPLVESITYWNFADGGWLGAPADYCVKMDL